jgi:signal transduction histidine kinase
VSQENEKNAADIWNWRSDSKGLIISVSSAFSASFGTQASQQIINHYLWEFITGSEQAPDGWQDLENAFKLRKRIKKFVFNYKSQGQAVKVALIGEPVYEKDQYIGHQGTGYIAENTETSIPEITKNMLSISIDSLDLGIAIFSKDTGLIEFNQHFLTHMSQSNITAVRNMSYEKLTLLVNNSNTFNEEISYTDKTQSCMYFERKNKSLLNIKKSYFNNEFIILKTEIDNHLLNNINAYQKSITTIQQKNTILERRISDYKDKLSGFFNKKTESNVSDGELKKLLSFFENNLDVGIMITDIGGKINSVNYYAAQLFGFVTVTMLMHNNDDKKLKSFLSQRQERILDLMDNTINHYEHTLELKNIIQETTVKEVITFFPSVHNPQRVISLFYKQPDEISDNNMYQFFINYIGNDIKSSLHTINGYNNLQMITDNNALKLSYIDHINNACTDLLNKASEVMNISKISSSLHNLEKSVFSLQDILSDCFNDFEKEIKENNIDLNFNAHDLGLLIISDKNIFHTIFNKLLISLIKSAKKYSHLDIKIVDDLVNNTININIQTVSNLNFKVINNMDISQIFNNDTNQCAGNLEYKIAEKFLELLGCTLTIIYHADENYQINIEIPDDIITSKYECDSSNIVI